MVKSARTLETHWLLSQSSFGGKSQGLLDRSAGESKGGRRVTKQR